MLLPCRFPPAHPPPPFFLSRHRITGVHQRRSSACSPPPVLRKTVQASSRAHVQTFPAAYLSPCAALHYPGCTRKRHTMLSLQHRLRYHDAPFPTMHRVLRGKDANTPHRPKPSGEAFRYHRPAEERENPPCTPRMPIFPEAPPAPKLQPASVAPLPAARKRPARKSLRTCRTSVKKRGSVARLSPGRRSLSPAQAGRCFASCVHALHLLPGSGAAMPASAKTPKPPHRQSTGGSFVPREGRAFQAQKKAPPGRGLIFTWR